MKNLTSYQEILTGRSMTFVRGWEQAVIKAKQSQRQMQRSQEQVAEFALRACRIRAGEKTPTHSEVQITLARFAEAVGVDRAILSSWVTRKKKVNTENQQGSLEKLG
jgi:hypothetical protein